MYRKHSVETFGVDTRFYQKVPGLGQERNSGLTDSILTAIGLFNLVASAILRRIVG
jgi:hypothetical protein